MTSISFSKGLISLKRINFFFILNHFKFQLLSARSSNTVTKISLATLMNLGFTRFGFIFFNKLTFGQFKYHFQSNSLKSSILRLRGIGYKCWRRGTGLFFDFSKSHFFCLKIPIGLKLIIRRRRGIILLSPNADLVSSFSYKIRSLAKPNVYTGKGVRFLGEFRRLKPGKQRR
jgi:hypothetical protein